MVHYFGQPQDISRFQQFCKQNDLILIDNNAHGHGGDIDGNLLGTFGEFGISSPRKNLNTISFSKDKNFFIISDTLLLYSLNSTFS